MRWGAGWVGVPVWAKCGVVGAVKRRAEELVI